MGFRAGVGAMIGPVVVVNLEGGQVELVMASTHLTDLLLFQFQKVGADDAPRFLQGTGQLRLRGLDTACLAVGPQAEIDKQFEGTVGKDTEGLSKRISGGKPAGRLLQVELGVGSCEGRGAHRLEPPSAAVFAFSRAFSAR